MTPQTVGRAWVLLKTANSYYADIDVCDGIIHATNVVEKHGDWTQPRTDRFWPVTEAVEVRWQDAAARRRAEVMF